MRILFAIVPVFGLIPASFASSLTDQWSGDIASAGRVVALDALAFLGNHGAADSLGIQCPQDAGFEPAIMGVGATHDPTSRAEQHPYLLKELARPGAIGGLVSAVAFGRLPIQSATCTTDRSTVIEVTGTRGPYEIQFSEEAVPESIRWTDSRGDEHMIVYDAWHLQGDVRYAGWVGIVWSSQDGPVHVRELTFSLPGASDDAAAPECVACTCEPMSSGAPCG